MVADTSLERQPVGCGTGLRRGGGFPVYCSHSHKHSHFPCRWLWKHRNEVCTPHEIYSNGSSITANCWNHAVCSYSIALVIVKACMHVHVWCVFHLPVWGASVAETRSGTAKKASSWASQKARKYGLLSCTRSKSVLMLMEPSASTALARRPPRVHQ